MLDLKREKTAFFGLNKAEKVNKIGQAQKSNKNGADKLKFM